MSAVWAAAKARRAARRTDLEPQPRSEETGMIITPGGGRAPGEGSLPRTVRARITGHTSRPRRRSS